MRHAAVLALLATMPAAAQELRLPEDAWSTRFAGLHAADGACDDADAVWAFALGTVEMGRTICTALGKMIWEDGRLVVPLSQCSRMGEPVEPGWVALRDAGDSAITALTADGAEVRLVACPPPG
jgi:hypothetical protein